MACLASQIEVAHVAQPHDVVPAQVFLEDVYKRQPEDIRRLLELSYHPLIKSKL